ncbi:MAG TPA: hypothetical protein VJ933_05755, partial [Phaeodactylibacter sp.]|nr:hypothetical protein [Phaeodactylibacter sp.]
VQISQLTAGLPSGYHRDFQLLKEAIFPALQQLKQCLSILNYALPHARPAERLLEDERYRYLFSVEKVNQLVLKGKPFREAYRIVGEQIAEGTFEPPKEIKHTHEGSIGNLCLPEIRNKWELTAQGFNFEQVERALSQLVQEV